MFRRLLRSLLFIGVLVASHAAPPPPVSWTHARVSPVKTSLPIGSVRLIPGEMIRRGNTVTGPYEVKVSPWFFWNESGQLTFTVTDLELVKLSAGQRVEFAGTATNHQGKLREVSGMADPIDAASGKIKVRIRADGFTLVFNTTYQLLDAATTAGTPP